MYQRTVNYLLTKYQVYSLKSIRLNFGRNVRNRPSSVVFIKHRTSKWSPLGTRRLNKGSESIHLPKITFRSGEVQLIMILILYNCRNTYSLSTNKLCTNNSRMSPGSWYDSRTLYSHFFSFTARREYLDRQITPSLTLMIVLVYLHFLVSPIHLPHFFRPSPLNRINFSPKVQFY